MATKPELRNAYKRRWSSLDTEFDPWRRQFVDISEYMMPRTGRWLLAKNERNKPPKYNSIIDNTATTANGILGAGMMAGMTSPARPWIRLATPDPDLMKYMPVKLWLADATSRMLNVFRRGNTYRALHSMYEELGAYGTGASMVQEDFNDVVRQYPLTAGEYRIATDFRGEVTTLYRQIDMTVGNMVTEFGREKVSSTVKNAFDRGNLDMIVNVMQVVEPRSDRDTTKRDSKNMPWKSVYFEMAADNPEDYLRESGYEEFPALVPRWVVKPGDVYGTSPGMMALGDTRSLQHEQLRKGQAIDYMTKPPLQVPTNLKGHESDLLPGGVSYVDMANPNAGIRTAFNVNVDISGLREDIMDVRQRIRSAFFADLFMMLSGSDHTRMTATEVAERHEEKLLMLGPVLERLHNEMLTPLVDITFKRMLESNMLPPPPQELQGQNLDIEFVSILAQAQRAVSTNSTDRFVANLGQVAQFKPDVLDKFNADEWAESYADALGVDPKLIIGGDEVALVRQQRAQAQQQQAMAAQAQQTAMTAKDLAGASTGEDSNLLTNVLNNLQGYSAPAGG